MANGPTGALAALVCLAMLPMATLTMALLTMALLTLTLLTMALRPMALRPMALVTLASWRYLLRQTYFHSTLMTTANLPWPYSTYYGQPTMALLYLLRPGRGHASAHVAPRHTTVGQVRY